MERIDYFISGAKVELPTPPHRRACDELLNTKSASLVTATLFLVFYWLEEPTWDRNCVPVGARGKYGDKRLCEELTLRNITLHKVITAYAENLGWKGNVQSKNIRLLEDNRFRSFLSQVADAAGDPDEMRKTADFYFPSERVVIFIDGCFWHGCPRCGHIPNANRPYWSVKIQRNQERDAQKTRLLSDMGLDVMRFWEHELKDDSVGCVNRLVAFLAAPKTGVES
jgi:DNA mismatch endonuclease Vsr